MPRYERIAFEKPLVAVHGQPRGPGGEPRILHSEPPRAVAAGTAERQRQPAQRTIGRGAIEGYLPVGFTDLQVARQLQVHLPGPVAQQAGGIDVPAIDIEAGGSGTSAFFSKRTVPVVTS